MLKLLSLYYNNLVAAADSVAVAVVASSFSSNAINAT
jgi:hypothetical protein